MTRLFCVAIMAAVLLAAPAWASVPDPANSSVTWMSLTPNGSAFVCWKGDGSWLDVYVRDQFNAPMNNVLVQVTFPNQVNGTIVLVGGVCQGFTVATGNVQIPIRAGLINPTPAGMTAGTTVTCLGITLYTNIRGFVSPDVNGDLTVDPLDYGFFAADYLPVNGPRSDYDGNTVVDPLDYGIFANHYLVH
ncbi:MAG: hypothetical protein V2A71_07380 [Candidatus Eisenbacteria bacterium]